MKPKLTDFLVALDLSKSTLKTIKLNLAWAFGYNIIAMPISAGLLYTFAGVYIPPAFAGVSEVLSSVPVVLFSLFLYKYKPPRY